MIQVIKLTPAAGDPDSYVQTILAGTLVRRDDGADPAAGGASVPAGDMTLRVSRGALARGDLFAAGPEMEPHFKVTGVAALPPSFVFEEVTARRQTGRLQVLPFLSRAWSIDGFSFSMDGQRATTE